jgi:hypothetical protein
MKPYGQKNKKVKVCSCCVSEAKSEKHRANKSSERRRAKNSLLKEYREGVEA